MLRAELVIPEFTFQVENEEEVVRAMGRYELEAVKRRLRAGQAADGSRFRAPKDGGKALQRSNQLLESIELIVKNYGRFWGATVEPSRAPRSEARDRAAAVRRQTKQRTARLRQSVEDELIAAGVAVEEIEARLKRIKVKGRRVHKSSMDIAAVLAYAPKDERAKSGDRARYDLFSTSEQEKKDLRKIAATVGSVALVEKNGARHRGRGVAD